jgi:hypothetical protein
VAGHEVFVSSFLDTFTLSATALASSASPGPYRIATALNAPAGLKWCRRGDTNEVWKQQTPWVFNNTSGNDENVGSALLPLKTVEEFYRRTAGSVTNNTQFTIQDGNYSFDMPIHAVAPGNSRARITVTGTPTQVATGTVSSTTAQAANNSARLTSTALSFAGLEGYILRMTSGAITGSIAPIVSDLGANTAEIPPGFCTDPSGGASGLPANGTTFEVLQPVQTISMATSLGVEATFKYFVCSDRIQTPLFVNVGCLVSNMSFLQASSTGYAGRMIGCSVMTTTVTIESSNVYFGYCAVLAQVNVANGSTLYLNKTVGRKATPSNAIFNVGNNDGSATGAAGCASLICNDVGLHEATNAAGIYVGAGGFCSVVASPLYGSGSEYGVSIANGGRMQIAVGITNPTVTGTSADILIDGVTTHIPPLVNGLVVPAPQPMVTWAAWAAAPFSTQVLKYGSGSSLIKGV